jgi:hypothetical protein
VGFFPFGGSISNFAVDTTEHHSGTASIRFDVPATAYAGGALVVTGDAVDVSGFDAVTFYAKVDAGTHTINVFGYGNDSAAGTNDAVERPAVALTTEWQRVVLPLPTDPSAPLRGLFHFAEGSEEGAYALFIDDLRFTTLEDGVLTNPRPAFGTAVVDRAVDATTTVAGTAVTYAIQDNGAAAPADFTLAPVAARYFDFVSSNTAVATVDEAGVITAVGEGSAVITATVGGVNAAGSVTVNVAGEIQVPDDVATAPTYAPADVISLFSTHYTNVPVSTFRAGFSAAELVDFAIPGTERSVKQYTLHNFVGIEMLDANQIDAQGKTALSMAVWTPDVESLLVKLVDIGPDGTFDGGNTVEAIVTIPIPPESRNQWITVEVPFSANPAFPGRNIAQVIIDGGVPAPGSNTLYVDDLLFH